MLLKVSALSWAGASKVMLTEPLGEAALNVAVSLAVPLTPGSLGVRENLFVSLFASVFVDKPHALLLSLLVYGGGVFWSLAGGIVYLTMGAAGEDKLPEMPDPWQEESGI